MADSGYICDKRPSSVAPACTCGEDPQTTCPLALWHKGCAKTSKVFARQCPFIKCALVIALCSEHGGEEEAMGLMKKHVEGHR